MDEKKATITLSIDFDLLQELNIKSEELDTSWETPVSHGIKRLLTDIDFVRDLIL